MTASDPRARIALFLERLRDMLPPRRAEPILAEVSALIEDRLADDAAPHSPEAVDRALAALGPPEALAASLTGESEAADLATTRAHGRLLPVVFGAHLLLAVVLTIVGSTTAFVPGIVGALPTSSPLTTAFGVLGVFFVDVGLVVVAVRLVGRDRVPALLHHVRLEMPGTRRDAALSLVLLVIVELLIDVLSVRDALFAIGTGDARAPILSEDAVRLIPAANGVLFLFALGRGFVAIRKRDRETHRVWMTRAFGIGLGITTVRLVAGPLDLIMTPMGYTTPTIFVVSLWVGWGLTTLGTEWWLYRTQRLVPLPVQRAVPAQP